MFSIFRRGSAPAAIASHEELQRASETGSSVIVDVREPGEFAAGRVPRARNMPLSQFNPSALPNDQSIILICQAGGRSAKALDACHAAGMTNARHYKPGTGGWIASGGKVER
jgi:rhodanese-related sulfurtransferase